jgi:hypothetical protein
MTVVVAVKISEGIAVASDSASSLMMQGVVVNIYNNANKIFNLRKKRPIGAMTSGAGSIGNLSISTIAKDFRRSAETPEADQWSVLDYANKFYDYVLHENYEKHHQQGSPNNPRLNFHIFGFSPGQSFPEIFAFSFSDTNKSPEPALPKESGGIAWGGEPEIVQRIMFGYGSILPLKLEELGVEKEKVDQALNAQKQSQLIICDAMPIQDAIDLAEFLVRSTIEFSRFRMGAPTVGGPVEVAAISKHEGFKWIKRKYYFDSRLNP